MTTACCRIACPRGPAPNPATGWPATDSSRWPRHNRLHPTTPLLAISAIYCPIHEHTPGPAAPDFADGKVQFVATGDPSQPGKLTLSYIRQALEEIVATRAKTDPNLSYLDGQSCTARRTSRWIRSPTSSTPTTPPPTAGRALRQASVPGREVVARVSDSRCSGPRTGRRSQRRHTARVDLPESPPLQPSATHREARRLASWRPHRGPHVRRRSR